ncbi:unnamed protein product [Leptidea sinapis]|uniref:Uncharacterized protein n=1 Tax=Leptidea sinapis TaxID=189913 RepID=A0A5E4PLQ7_9NEOP|nr:unnamed protein product [Leptidea sinapis]
MKMTVSSGKCGISEAVTIRKRIMKTHLITDYVNTDLKLMKLRAKAAKQSSECHAPKGLIPEALKKLKYLDNLLNLDDSTNI